MRVLYKLSNEWEILFGLIFKVDMNGFWGIFGDELIDVVFAF
ncbi:MAG: hypothetical protein CENE_02327 [Candidatus Celerinatantimonas neptuna]|nr:MAG: hypothetical protein CENE_02327 [Candidatus Celerinatantimonas neptuna]